MFKLLKRVLDLHLLEKLAQHCTLFIFLLFILPFAQSCDTSFGSGPDGSLLVHFVENGTFPTKIYGDAVDTNKFILSIADSKGASVYYGSFGAAPEKIIAAPGTYTITAKSCEFTTPEFDCPQYGDTQVAVVSAGKECRVLLNCDQLNSGVRLKVDPAFLSEYPQGVLFLKSADGKLMYGYSERRIAYFRPGNVSLVLNDNGKESILCSRYLEARQVLQINLTISDNQSANIAAGIHIQVDTTRNWTTENICIGADDPDKGNEKENAYSIAQAKDNIGASDVWVYGYIVGGDLSSSRCSFEAPFSSRTNIAIAAKSSCTDKEACLSVQLSQGKIRDALNLVDNPGLLGKMVYIKGDIVESYYGIPGIQSIVDYSL
ncbi:MAG: DUF6359 domain-containing protein [Candidatus Cryptobacteroides sp.]